MDSATITNLIKNLGRSDFRNVVKLVLTRVLNLTVINVDGPRDGGSDWRAFEDAGDGRVIAFQDTTQKRNWEQKAFEDAEKAVRDLGAKRYFFLTTNDATNTKLRKIENSIFAELQIPATCLGAGDIAGFIADKGLETDFLDAIGAPLARGMGNRPDMHEMCLHAYLTLGSETHELKNTVYDDTVFLLLHTEDELIQGLNRSGHSRCWWPVRMQRRLCSHLTNRKNSRTLREPI